jgi:hypothetical protein
MVVRDLVIWLKSRCRNPSGSLDGPCERSVSIGVICLYKAQAFLVTKLLADAGFAVGVTDPGAIAVWRDKKVHSGVGTGDERDSVEAFDYDESAEDEQLREMHDQNNNNNGNGECSSSGSGRSRKEGGSHPSMGELRVSTVDAFQVTDGEEKLRYVICPLVNSLQLEEEGQERVEVIERGIE